MSLSSAVQHITLENVYQRAAADLHADRAAAIAGIRSRWATQQLALVARKRTGRAGELARGKHTAPYTSVSCVCAPLPMRTGRESQTYASD